MTMSPLARRTQFRFGIPSLWCAVWWAVAAGGLTLAAQQQSVDGTIAVGRNVLVSSARQELAHNEVWLGTDPTNARRLLACSMFRQQDANESGSIVYQSLDGGATWKPTFELAKSGDPICEYGPDGTAFYLVLALPEAPGVESVPEAAWTRLYRSSDGGSSWGRPTVFTFIDREFIAFDTSRTPYQIYINGTKSAPQIETEARSIGIALFSSTDKGATFAGPVMLNAPNPRYVLGMGNTVVLSDGTVLSVFGELRDYWTTRELQANAPGRSNARLRVATLADGGARLSLAGTIGDYYMPAPRIATQIGPRMAVDRNRGPFHDRVYVTWPDQRSGNVQILFSYSTDKGKTWTPPAVVNDDRPPLDRTQRPDHFMASAAVNRDGVVGVMWYDRRNHATDLGWDVRFTASLDGGDTFLPSVKVSEAPHTFSTKSGWITAARGSGGGTRTPGSAPAPPARSPLTVTMSVDSFHYTGGHTAGLMADADGVFRPLWIDNRTGSPQMWTAPVTVTGRVMKHGSTDLSSLADVTGRVSFELSSSTFDRSTGTARMTARLKNTSEQPIKTPLKVRVTSLRSEVGAPEIVNADNRRPGAGALWDFSGLVPDGVLEPKGLSQPKTLIFRLTDVRPFRQGTEFKFGLVSFDARVLASQDKPAGTRAAQ
jgi:hypothetical protein